MKKISSKLSALLLSLALLLPCAVPVQAAQGQARTDEELNSVIQHVFSYAKQGEQALFSDAFLQQAREEGGSWLALSAGRYGWPEDPSGLLKAMQDYVAGIYNEEIPAQNPWETDKPAGQLKSVTDTAKVALWIAALGGNPQAVDLGQGGQADLLADLYSGVFPLASDSYVTMTLFRLLALDAAGLEIPADAAYQRDAMIQAILETQLDNGAFGWETDYDSTAMVLQALAPYYGNRQDVTAAVDRTLALLSSAQLENGGFGAPSTENTETTAQVLAALNSLNIDPYTDARFVKNGHTVVDGLLQFYNEADGGFLHSARDEESDPGLPTQQGLYALISQYRYQTGQRRLYDFAAEPDNDRFVLESGGKRYAVERESGNYAYSLELPAGTEQAAFAALPTGAYGASATKLNEAFSVEDGKTLTVVITGQNAGTYTIAIRLAQEEASSAQNPSSSESISPAPSSSASTPDTPSSAGGASNPSSPATGQAPASALAFLFAAGGCVVLLHKGRRK